MDSNSRLWSSAASPPPPVLSSAAAVAELATAAPTIFPRVGYSVLSFLMFINTLLSVFNNGLVITVMLRNPSLLHPMNVFLLSLAVSDLMIGLCGSLVVTITNYYGSFFIGRAACVFQGFAVNYFGKCEAAAATNKTLICCCCCVRRLAAFLALCINKGTMYFLLSHRLRFVCCNGLTRS